MDDAERQRQAVVWAAGAVAHAARPSLVRAVHARAVTWPTGDRIGDVARVVAEAMLDPVRQAMAVPWWMATGELLTDALCVVVDGLGEWDASYLVGAALYAHILGGQDLVADGVLRLGERAACWAAGVTHVTGNFLPSPLATP